MTDSIPAYDKCKLVIVSLRKPRAVRMRGFGTILITSVRLRLQLCPMVTVNENQAYNIACVGQYLRGYSVRSEYNMHRVLCGRPILNTHSVLAFQTRRVIKV
jgi:hypothetical protein